MQRNDIVCIQQQILLQQLYRMRNNSIEIGHSDVPDPFLILAQSLQRTSSNFSLDHCLEPKKDIHKTVTNKECRLKHQLEQIAFEKQEQHLESYWKESLEELTELREYYKYYTQTSITYQPTFFKVMHCYRQQKKAVQYNRLKVMLELSSSTHTDSEDTHKLDNTLISSFRLLSLLKLTNTNEESLLIMKLKDNLQKDYGPNRYTSIQELDKHYCFTKTMNRVPTAERLHTRKSSKKQTKATNQREPLIFKNKTNIFRCSSTGSSGLNSTRKESKGKANRRKHLSMDNISSLTRQNSSIRSTKCQKTKPEARDMQVKKTILGVKEQIRKEKQLLMRRGETGKGKKTLLQSCKLTRKLRH